MFIQLEVTVTVIFQVDGELETAANACHGPIKILKGPQSEFVTITDHIYSFKIEVAISFPWTIKKDILGYSN